MIYLHIIPWKADDVRKYSPFISSIRFSTLLVLSIFICAWLMFPKHRSWRWVHPVFYGGAIVFFFGFIALLKSLTGIIALIGAGWIIWLAWGLRRRKMIWKAGVTIVAVAIPLFLYGYIRKQVNDFYTIEKVDFSELPFSTPNGSVYKHDTTSWQLENGHYVRLYVSRWELKQEWNKRSSVDYFANDKKGWPIYETLTRFITSKGWKKNAQAVQQLTDEEIRAVENGCTNVRYMHPLRISSRIYQVIWEYYDYSNTNNPNGKSLATRLEYWKHGWNAVKRSPWIGYGTGDVRNALNRELGNAHSLLDPKEWKNPHQQYLSVALAVGFTGLAVFLLLLVAPLFLTKNLHYLQLAFLCIVLIAMLDDDPLETQAGVTQVSLWFCLLFSVFPFTPANGKKNIG
jgi:O-antigen ligase